jgi:hypothetical protein
MKPGMVWLIQKSIFFSFFLRGCLHASQKNVGFHDWTDGQSGGLGRRPLAGQVSKPAHVFLSFLWAQHNWLVDAIIKLDGRDTGWEEVCAIRRDAADHGEWGGGVDRTAWLETTRWVRGGRLGSSLRCPILNLSLYLFRFFSRWLAGWIGPLTVAHPLPFISCVSLLFLELAILAQFIFFCSSE